MNLSRKGFGLTISCDIMENRLYFNRNKICRRIFRAFRESNEETLTTQEIINALFEQKTATGKPFINRFTKQTITQTLNKYPFFLKTGTKTVKSIAGNTMNVNCWAIVEEEE